MIVSAACSSFLSFMKKVSTGFLAAESSHNISKGGSGSRPGPAGNSLNHPQRSFYSFQDSPIGLASTAISIAVRRGRDSNAEGRDNDSFGSEGILVRKSVDIDNE